MCKLFWSVHGLHGLLRFALSPSCRGIGLTLRTDGYHSMKFPNRTKHTTHTTKHEGRSVQIREGCFLHGSLFVQIQQARNFQTRRCSKWCRMLTFDPFSWRAKEKVDSNARDAELCVLSDHSQKTRRRHSPAAVYTNTQLRGVGRGRPHENAVARHWHATCAERVSFSAVFSQ